MKLSALLCELCFIEYFTVNLLFHAIIYFITLLEYLSLLNGGANLPGT